MCCEFYFGERHYATSGVGQWSQNWESSHCKLSGGGDHVGVSLYQRCTQIMYYKICVVFVSFNMLQFGEIMSIMQNT
jgi:hypothetical protein